MNTITRLVVPLALSAALAGCAATAPTKAGAEIEPVTLSLLAYSGNVADETKEYAAAAAKSSGGKIVLRDAPEIFAGATDGSSDAIQAVQAGKVDLAVVAARTFDLHGSNAMQALSAPLAVDSPAQAALLLSDPVADKMLAGLSQARVVGLGLIYGQLGQPLGFSKPILVPSDLKSAKVLVRPSGATEALVLGVGGTPDPRNGDEAAKAIASADVAATVTSMERTSGSLAGPGGRASTVTGNLQLLIKADVIIANPKVWNGLSQLQQAALREAAVSVRDWSTARAARLDLGATVFCMKWGNVALATTAQRDAWRIAVAPTIAKLAQESDVTREALARLKQIVADHPSDDHPVACTKRPKPKPVAISSPSPSPSAPAVDPAGIAGTWRLDATAENMRKTGASERDAIVNQGTWTFVLRADGSYKFIEPHLRTCPGTFTVTQDHLTMTDDTSVGDCDLVWRLTWKRMDDNLKLTPTPEFSASEPGLDGFWANPLVRVGDAPAK